MFCTQSHRSNSQLQSTMTITRHTSALWIFALMKNRTFANVMLGILATFTQLNTRITTPICVAINAFFAKAAWNYAFGATTTLPHSRTSEAFAHKTRLAFHTIRSFMTAPLARIRVNLAQKGRTFLTSNTEGFCLFFTNNTLTLHEWNLSHLLG